MSEISAKYNEFIEALKESTRSFEVKVDIFAKETRISLAKLDKSVAITSDRINVVSEVVKPLPTQMARLETTVEQIAKNDQEQWVHITKVRGDMRKLEVKMAENHPRAKTSHVSFWDGPNAKLVIMLISTIAIGLLSLAGYQVTK